MVDIQSKEVIDKISEQLKIQPALMIPREIGKDIQLTFDVNTSRVADTIADGFSSSTGALIFFITPTDRDFFLTSTYLNITKDVSNDNTATTIEVTPFGKAEFPVIQIISQTLTVANNINSVTTFATPIKLERGSNIRIIGPFTVGAMGKGAIITGFTTDPL